MSKYNAVKCEQDNFKFDSLFERELYRCLRKMELVGELFNLEMQKKFVLKSFTGKAIAKYIADFYCIFPDNTQKIFEAKGCETTVWRLKYRHFIADYPEIDLIVVKRIDDYPFVRNKQSRANIRKN